MVKLAAKAFYDDRGISVVLLDALMRVIECWVCWHERPSSWLFDIGAVVSVCTNVIPFNPKCLLAVGMLTLYKINKGQLRKEIED
ncbi:hypothetical protein Q3G72_000236 [Acer saccharum]|nr:hypothetical protein Q3G72_000236 [Acer saccharum]